jgi:N4-gp56 family major capsid protein
MGKTAFTTSDALTKKAWEEKLYRDAVKETFWSKFEGDGPENIIHVKNQLTKDKGDKVTFGIRMRLTGAGVTSGTILEGNEESLTTYSDDVTLEQYRHAVRDDGKLSHQRAMFNIDEESEQALKDWASERVDQLKFDAILASPTRVAYLDGGASGVFSTTTTAATAKTGVNATYKASATFLSALKTWAKTGGNRSSVPLRPLKVKGESVYALLTHPDVIYDLRQDSSVVNAWLHARERGADNPLFRDADIIYDGIAVFGHENMPIAADAGAGSNVKWAKGVLLGKQALVWANGQRGKVVKKTFDYDNETGFGWSIICGTNKPVFNSVDYGSLGVYFARSGISA